MIVHTAAIHEVAGFVAGLQAAAAGVVRVSVHSGEAGAAVSTGWLVTHELVLIPNYVVAHRAEWEFVCRHGDEEQAAGLAFVPPGALGERAAVLRLAGPLSARPLRIAMRPPADATSVIVVHHPEGLPAAFFSMGTVLGREGAWLRYDADTTRGSGGGPVFDLDWAVAAMHMKGMSDPQPGEPRFNEGISVSALLDGLSGTPVWPEIARQHQLLDAPPGELRSPAPPPAATDHDPELLAAAVHWSFHPGAFSDGAVERLHPRVVAPELPRWTLTTAARTALLRSAGSLEALRRARGDDPPADAGQAVVDRILAGPPYKLEDVEEQDLTYWLQASRWFADIVPELPTPAQVNRTLARRRVRSRLEVVGGALFRGRREELSDLGAWYAHADAGPMVVTGIGGVGKSALVSRFALDLPGATVLLWLDFDRADLAPDDPASVLRVLAEQLAIQLDGFMAPEADDPRSFGEALKPLLDGAPPPLLVLDGFEVAQHAARHQEIWTLIQQLLPWLAGARVLVSGRAPVTELRLQERLARILRLEGLGAEDSAAWLQEAGIVDDDVIARVVGLTRGVPLALRLAVRWIEAGGDVKEVPQDLRAELVQGFLYQRILDRVMDPALKRVARDALVLRRLTADMIPEVLADTIPPGVEPGEVFRRLGRELALVRSSAELSHSLVALSDTDVLQLRPEVRAATLELLEAGDADRVREIDARAERWYVTRAADDPAAAAELVYHRLRLQNLAGADAAWRDDCADRLVDAGPELAVRARRWLASRIADAGRPAVESWERAARARIVDLVQRGLLHRVAPVLEELDERSDDSRLVLYDAWQAWRRGDPDGARDLLGRRPVASPMIKRDRALLAALVARETGDRSLAEVLLADLADKLMWPDATDAGLQVLTVQAAQIQLAVDLHAELQLLRVLERETDTYLRSLTRLLAPADVVLPPLARSLRTSAVESPEFRLWAPEVDADLEGFAREVDRVRREGVWAASDAMRLVASPSASRQSRSRSSPTGLGAPHFRLAQRVADLGWRRWRHASSSLVLAHAVDATTALYDRLNLQRLAIAGTLAAFTSSDAFQLWRGSDPVYSLLALVVEEQWDALGSGPARSRISRARAVLERIGEHDAAELVRSLQETGGMTAPSATVHYEIILLMFHLLAPDPLELLVRQALGLPDSVELRDERAAT